MLNHKKMSLYDAAILAVLLAITFISLVPLLYTVALSLSDSAAAQGGMVFLWPVNFSLASYEKVVADVRFFNAFGISVERVLLGGGVNFVLTCMMGFALSKETKEFRFRNAYMWVLVFTMMFHGGLIPWYLTVKNYGLINSIWSLILPGAVPVFNVILLMNFFRKIPKEMNEAAVIDGAGPWYTMLMLYVPLSLPALSTVTLFSVINHWNSFFDGLVFMSKANRFPLATYIQSIVVQLHTEVLSTDELIELTKISTKTLNAAKIIVAMVPILLIYPFAQKYFISGITLGSVKE